MGALGNGILSRTFSIAAAGESGRGADHWISAGCGLPVVDSVATVVVDYVPNARSQAQPMFSVMLQLQGTIKAAQCGRVCGLGPGEFCVIDGLARLDL